MVGIFAAGFNCSCYKDSVRVKHRTELDFSRLSIVLGSDPRSVHKVTTARQDDSEYSTFAMQLYGDASP